MNSLLLFVGGMFTGWLLFIGLASYRAISGGEWDDSNIMNWLRMIVHLILHPGDFKYAWYTKMIVVDGHPLRVATRQVGWYTPLDELSEVVDVRPRPEEKI